MSGLIYLFHVRERKSAANSASIHDCPQFSINLRQKPVAQRSGAAARIEKHKDSSAARKAKQFVTPHKFADGDDNRYPC
jgi:hypothetical protein